MTKPKARGSKAPVSRKQRAARKTAISNYFALTNKVFGSALKPGQLRLAQALQDRQVMLDKFKAIRESKWRAVGLAFAASLPCAADDPNKPALSARQAAALAADARNIRCRPTSGIRYQRYVRQQQEAASRRNQRLHSAEARASALIQEVVVLRQQVEQLQHQLSGYMVGTAFVVSSVVDS
jgi:hypothetical protein